MITTEKAIEILDIYKQAWEMQDSELILTIFNSDAIYHEKVFEAPYIGHKSIKKYWQNKVVNEQRNIKFKLLNTYIDSNTLIAEWESEFDDITQQVRKRIKEVAIIEFQGEKIASLREYWASKLLPHMASQSE